MIRVLAIGAFLAVAAAAGGCASARGPLRSSDEFIVYPTPPDTARVQFLFTFSNEEDVIGRKKGGGLLGSLAGEPDEVFDEFDKPYGISFANGRIYVCDTMLPGIVTVDLAARTFERLVPRSLGTLRKPINCFANPADGRLYVADTERAQIVVFDSTLSYVGAFGDREGARPSDVFVDGPRIWVTDLEARLVRVFDRTTFREIRSFPDPDVEDDARLFAPTNLYVTQDLVYVSDFGDFRVKAYTHDGEFVRSFGSYGRGLGQFVRPKGIAVDRAGRLYVVDAGFENVQVFDSNAELLMFFGGPYQGPGDMWLPAKVAISYDRLDLFRDYVQPGYVLEYVLLVTNQYGPDRVNVYGFIHPAETATDDST